MNRLKELVENQNNLFVASVLTLAVLTGVAAGAYTAIDTSSQNTSYDTYVQVNQSEDGNISAGLETGNGMEFGQIVEGTNITKSLNVGSSNLALVSSSVEGNISENLSYREEVLFTNETTLDFEYAGRDSGYYQGEIILNIKTANNYWGEKWLELLYQLR